MSGKQSKRDLGLTVLPLEHWTHHFWGETGIVVVKIIPGGCPFHVIQQDIYGNARLVKTDRPPHDFRIAGKDMPKFRRDIHVSIMFQTSPSALCAPADSRLFGQSRNPRAMITRSGGHF